MASDSVSRCAILYTLGLTSWESNFKNIIWGMVLGHWDGGVGGIVLGALTPFDHHLPSRVGNGEMKRKASCLNNTNLHSLISTDQCPILDHLP